VTHHPAGVIWPRQRPGGSDALPMVLVEVQMHPDRRFHRRLGAETFRLLQQHEEVEHLQVLVLWPSGAWALAPTSRFCCAASLSKT
jgi:hypothetical protein